MKNKENNNMAKLTLHDFVKTMDRDISEEVYAKLVALRMEYEVDKTTNFDPKFFELCYQTALKTIKDMKLSKIQLVGCTLHQSQELEKIGFTRQHLLKLAGLNM